MDIKNFCRQQISKIIRYSLVGMVNTSVTVSIMAILAWLKVDYRIYTAIGYIAGMSMSFVLNFRFTFKATGYIKKRLIAFFSINLFNLAIVEIIQIGLIQWQHTSTLVALIIGMIWYVIFGFILNQCLAFRKI